MNTYQQETFEKCFPLKAGLKFKEGENFNWRNPALAEFRGLISLRLIEI